MPPERPGPPLNPPWGTLDGPPGSSENRADVGRADATAESRGLSSPAGRRLTRPRCRANVARTWAREWSVVKGLAGMSRSVYESDVPEWGFSRTTTYLMALVCCCLSAGVACADDPAARGSHTPAASATPAFTPAEARLKADVSFLAADAQEGRRLGPRGSRRRPNTSPGSSRSWD